MYPDFAIWNLSAYADTFQTKKREGTPAIRSASFFNRLQKFSGS